jgi:hypothetical protein
MWSRAESPRPLYQKTRSLFETLRNEFAGLYVPPASEQEAPVPFFQLGLTTEDLQTLSFFSLTPSWQASAWVSRPARIAYTFVINHDTNEGHLDRREQLWSANVPIGEENSQTLAAGLKSCDFFVIDPNDIGNTEGRRTFTARDKPPKAIRIRLTWPNNEQKEDVVFETCLTIPCQGNVPQENNNP